MIKQVFILINSHIDVISRLIAFTGISAGAVNHHAFDVECHFTIRESVHPIYILSQIRNVNTSITFSGHVKLIFFKIGKFVEKFH